MARVPLTVPDRASRLLALWAPALAFVVLLAARGGKFLPAAFAVQALLLASAGGLLWTGALSLPRAVAPPLLVLAGAHLLSSAVQNIRHEEEERLRARLEEQRMHAAAF